MNQLKLVWQLEKYNSIIDDCKKNLNKLEDSIELKNMNKRIIGLESDINMIQVKIKDNSKLTTKLERSLKDYDYTKNKVEEDLYSGQVTDIKQLEQLSSDKEGIFELIDAVESKILKLIDDNEVLEKNYTTIRDDYDQLRADAAKMQEEANTMIEELKERIQVAQEEKDNIIPKIDSKILKRYDLTRGKRGKAIVLVSNEICGGCNVRIPTYLMADIKKQTEIIYCESCGRLLYYIDSNEQ